MRRLLILALFATLSLTVCYGKRDKERLTPYLADSAVNTGIAVIVCPGGSYSWLDKESESVEVGRWLQANGINAFVLEYRVATVAAYVTGYRVLGLGNRYPDMLEDMIYALIEVNVRADEWGVKRDRIGVMGFSAGGHLAMMSYLYNRTEWKPAFLCPVYPVVTMRGEEAHTRSRRGALGVWGQWNSQMRDSLSIERHVTSDCPPVFMVCCEDDEVVSPRNSEMLDSALTAKGVRHTYIKYKTGGHGFGASDSKGTSESRQWKSAFIEWLLE